MKNKLSTRKDITAVFARDDIIAAIVYEAAKEIGLRIPEDIAIVGHNDLYIARLLEPKLSTVHEPIF